jgi:ribosome biogenesis GTPase / thiamine phosphate phosphatase
VLVIDPGALCAFAWDNRVLALLNALDNPTPLPARVVRVERSACVVVTPDGKEQLVTAPVLPAVGDWVALEGGTVHTVLPRWSALTRVDPSGAGDQVLAANIDLVFITAPADRISRARVERELSLAWDSGAQPVVVLTKADLAGPELLALLKERLVGADIVPTSATTGLGIETLRSRLAPAQTAVLLGPSGAGKSTLLNALVGSEMQAVGAVRDGDHRGRHTTTSRQMVSVPGGGVLIDTPGLRSLALGREGGIAKTFADVGVLARQCRFADCSHQREPGCAVALAVSTGQLGPERLASYQKLQREMAVENRRVDPLARKVEQRLWKERSKLARLHEKRKQRKPS